MRDVLDDDERKVKPVSLLMITTAAILGSMIIYNAVWSAGTVQRHQLFAEVPAGATTRMEVAVPSSDASTVVIKYDPLVEDVQRELLALGDYKGMVDGVNGQRTKQAIQQYQQTNGLAVNGEVSTELVTHIMYTRKIKAASETTGSIDPVPAKIIQDDSAKITKVQTALANLGYDLGEASGQLDEPTRAAILQFEMEKGLAMDGSINAELMAALSKPAGQ
jgi:peptidoglycan hydrolase-like protein with peptidoglycan-binding domain